MISAAFWRAMQRGGASKSHVLVPENVVLAPIHVWWRRKMSFDLLIRSLQNRSGSKSSFLIETGRLGIFKGTFSDFFTLTVN